MNHYFQYLGRMRAIIKRDLIELLTRVEAKAGSPVEETPLLEVMDRLLLCSVK